MSGAQGLGRSGSLHASLPLVAPLSIGDALATALPPPVVLQPVVQERGHGVGGVLVLYRGSCFVIRMRCRHGSPCTLQPFGEPVRVIASFCTIWICATHVDAGRIHLGQPRPEAPCPGTRPQCVIRPRTEMCAAWHTVCWKMPPQVGTCGVST